MYIVNLGEFFQIASHIRRCIRRNVLRKGIIHLGVAAIDVIGFDEIILQIKRRRGNHSRSRSHIFKHESRIIIGGPYICKRVSLGKQKLPGNRAFPRLHKPIRFCNPVGNQIQLHIIQTAAFYRKVASPILAQIDSVDYIFVSNGGRNGPASELQIRTQGCPPGISCRRLYRLCILASRQGVVRKQTSLTILQIIKGHSTVGIQLLYILLTHIIPFRQHLTLI